MPKEIVYSAGAVEGPAEDTRNGYHVKVGWTAEREVQIGIEANEGRSLFWTLLGCASNDAQDEGVRRVGAWLRAAIEETSTPVLELDDRQIARLVLNTLDGAANGQYGGVWVDIDRRGCNRLIGLIRKARDMAYGRDE